MSLNQLDQRLAQELHKRKQDSLIRQKQIEKIINESEDIKLLKERIRQAYTNKERAAQVAEKQTRKLADLQQDAEMDEYLVQKKMQEQRELEEKERRLAQERLKQKYVLQEQMKYKHALKEEALKEFEKEKTQVDKIVLDIIREDQK